MKVKYILNEETNDEYFNAEHLVLCYGVWNENTKIYLLADEELEVIEPYDKNLAIVDASLSDYENFPKLNYGKEFYVQKDFLEIVKKFESYQNFKIESIWVKSKLKNFYSNYDYKFSQHFKDTVLNENYKIGQIKGFLTFANHYINVNNRGSSYRNSFHFGVAENLDSLMPERFRDEHFSFEEIENSNYSENLLKFINEKLINGNEKSGDENVLICRDLFELIDCIFMEQVGKAYRIRMFYDDMIVIEYLNKYYFLNYDWTS